MQVKQQVKVTGIAYAGYSVTDLKRARGFYEGILGLKQSSMFGDEDSGWVEYDIGPNTLSIGNGAPDWKPSPHGGIVALEVEDFDATMERFGQEGVPIVVEPMETPGCWMAVVSDPDGNSVLIHRRKG